MNKKRGINRISPALLFLMAMLITGCPLTRERPINKLPDGNKDRILKEAFSGSNEDPKYWMYKVTVVNTNFEERSEPYS